MVPYSAANLHPHAQGLRDPYVASVLYWLFGQILFIIYIDRDILRFVPRPRPLQSVPTAG